MSIGFIGCGNMATAIIKGITENNIIDSDEIFVFDTNKTALESVCGKYDLEKCSNSKQVVKKSDFVFLAVKPNVITEVLNEIGTEIKKKKPVIVSIAAGKTIEFLRSCLSENNKIVRVMPNINAKVNEAMCAYCVNELVEKAEEKEIERILAGIGKVTCLEESYFPLFGVLGGCAPAYTYMFIDALARAGVQNGMPKAKALEIAAQTVYGSAKMILESKENPWSLVDRVCSPGGTTIEGIISLQSDGFETAVHNAVSKALDKDKKL